MSDPLQPVASGAPGTAWSRRDFLRHVGGGLVVLCYAEPTRARVVPEADSPRPHAGEREPRELAAWLHVAEDGTITAYTGKVEIGQNTRTSLSQAIAEELRVEIDRVRLVMGDTAQVPFDNGTFASLTTPTMGRGRFGILPSSVSPSVPIDAVGVNSTILHEQESGT